MTQTHKIKYFRRKYLKTSKNKGCGNISPQLKKIKKIEIKGKWKGKELLCIFISLIQLIYTFKCFVLNVVKNILFKRLYSHNFKSLDTIKY